MKNISKIILCTSVVFSLTSCLSCNKVNNEGVQPGPVEPGEEVVIPDQTASKTEIYKYSNQISPSIYYTVRVNGEKAMVIPTKEHHVCTFGADGPVSVEVVPMDVNAESVEVLPLSKNYSHSISNNSLKLILSPGDRVAVEFNGREERDLFIFVNPIDENKPDENDPNVIYCKAGTITTPNGALDLSSGKTLYLEGGAILKGVLTAGNASAFTENVTIAGGGIIDSRGVNARGIQFRKIKNLTIQDVTILNDINWTTFISESQNVNITNYKIVAVENPENATGCENDALDILGCQDVYVKGCFGYAHDDVFCIKAHKWDFKGTTKNVVFDDCIAWNYLSGNSFVIGAETNEPISDVTYKNSYSIHSAGRPLEKEFFRGALSIHHCAGGHISNILFENIILEDCKEYGIYLDIRETAYQIGQGVTWTPGTMDGVRLKNIQILKNPPLGNVLYGYDNNEHKIKNLVFENVTQQGKEINASNIKNYFSLMQNTDITFK